MSAGDVVFDGWLIKSPPEKKLKRFAWRKRWFVLRRGRMSGNPDVLEYYRNKTSKKPIRTIDLKESEVQMQTEQRLVKREFQNQHLFVVKTSSRIFYLVAKTEEEMNSWVDSISQICHFASLDDGTESEERLSNTPTSEQPSPALSLISNHDRSQSEETFEPYLFLSQCETGGRVSISRCDSFSNSERSLEQNSSDVTIEDSFSSPPCTDPSPSPFAHTGPCPSPFPHMRVTDPPFSAPCAPSASERPLLDFSSSSSSSPRTLQRTPDIFQFDKPYPSADGQTPPPLPPKPSHLSEQQAEESPLVVGGQPAHLPRRITMSGLEHFRRGDVEGAAMRNWNKRLSLNLTPFIAAPSPNIQEDSYVPMTSPSLSVADDVSDGYIPMSPSSITFPKANSSIESPPPLGLPGELAPPPVNRNLKPRRKARPPPLDLTGLSTIREYPPHLPLSRTMTEPSNSVQCFRLERRHGNGGFKDQEASSISKDSRLPSPTAERAAQPWAKSWNLDYLSLDFNSASPSPVQKKALLADEHRVAYVKVDEKKTIALQNTTMEWKGVRQSKV